MRALALLAVASPMEGPESRPGTLEEAKGGDLAAFELLMRQHERRVLVTALRMLGNLEDAQDVSQEVFLRLYCNLGKLQSFTSVPAWLYRVTINLCHDVHRRRAPAAPVEEAGDLPAAGADPQESATEAERRRVLEMSLRMLLALMLIALPLAGQEEKKPEAKPWVQKIFMLKYADPNQVRNLLAVFGVNLQPNQEMHTLAVGAPADVMAAIENAVKTLDVPSSAPRNVELTVYFVIGADMETQYGGPMPKDLESVVGALKTTFPFKEYRLMDVMNLRTRTGQRVDLNSNAGTISVDNHSAFITTGFHIDSSSLSAEGTSLRLDKMRASARIPYPNPNGFTMQDLGINEDMDVKEGQKVVVGRVGISRDQALFVVLSAKVMP